MKKFEIRNPKFETNSKSEIRIVEFVYSFALRDSLFGFASGFEFRISSFPPHDHF
jgi:hypothetical protein